MRSGDAEFTACSVTLPVDDLLRFRIGMVAIGTPVVGNDTVIAPGSAFHDTIYNDETPFLLIGRMPDD